MATFQSGLRALSGTTASLEGIVARLDRYARAHSLEGRRFTTAFLAEIDPATRKMRYTNCGHNDPILRRASGAIERLARAARRWVCRFSPTTKSSMPRGMYNWIPEIFCLFLRMAWSKR